MKKQILQTIKKKVTLFLFGLGAKGLNRINAECFPLKRDQASWNYRVKMSLSLLCFSGRHFAMIIALIQCIFLPYLLQIIKLSTSQPILIYIRCYLRAIEFEFVL